MQLLIDNLTLAQWEKLRGACNDEVRKKLANCTDGELDEWITGIIGFKGLRSYSTFVLASVRRYYLLQKVGEQAE